MQLREENIVWRFMYQQLIFEQWSLWIVTNKWIIEVFSRSCWWHCAEEIGPNRHADLVLPQKDFAFDFRFVDFPKSFFKFKNSMAHKIAISITVLAFFYGIVVDCQHPKLLSKLNQCGNWNVLAGRALTFYLHNLDSCFSECDLYFFVRHWLYSITTSERSIHARNAQFANENDQTWNITWKALSSGGH